MDLWLGLVVAVGLPIVMGSAAYLGWQFRWKQIQPILERVEKEYERLEASYAQREQMLAGSFHTTEGNSVMAQAAEIERLEAHWKTISEAKDQMIADLKDVLHTWMGANMQVNVDTPELSEEKAFRTISEESEANIRAYLSGEGISGADLDAALEDAKAQLGGVGVS